jgi:hypothetical protein
MVTSLKLRMFCSSPGSETIRLPLASSSRKALWS